MENLHLSLYRKYRPVKFSQVIGQNFVVKTLKLAVKNNCLSHAYIFSGTRGSGKTSIAKIFSKAVNCLNFVDDICNECKICKSINDNTNLDIIELDAASNNGVNEIKELIDTVKYSPSEQKYKVYIIDEAHMLSTSAWNALLKTIEEPPKHVIFIFATTEFYKIPTTIISRCQRYDFSKLTVSELEKLISYVCDNENILISNNAKNKIALLSDGGARDCLSILDQLANYSNNNIKIEDVENLFGLASNQIIIQLINCLISNNNKFEIVNNLIKKGIDYLWTLNQLLRFLIDKVVYLKTNDNNLINYLSINELFSIECEDTNLLIQIINDIVKCYENIKKYGNPEFYFEYLFLNNNDINSNNNNSGVENNVDENSFNLEEIFKTQTVTNIYKEKFEKIENNEINDLDTKKADNYNFNYLIDDSSNIINPYSKQNSNYNNSVCENTPNYDWLNIFLSIATNNNPTILKMDIDNLEKLKSDFLANSNIDMLLKNIEKILVSSKNGIIILFNYKNEADKFNNFFWNPETYNLIANKLNVSNRLIYAIDKKQAVKWFDLYKKNQTKQYDDVKLSLIDCLNKNIDEDSELKQKIIDIINK